MIGGGSIKDAPQLKINRDKIFDLILANDNKLTEIINKHSEFQSELYQKRREDILRMIEALDNENTVVRVVENIRGSKIKADFIIQYELNKNQKYWIFLQDRSRRANKNMPNEYSTYCVSSAFTDNKNFEANQAVFSVLYKAKKNLLTSDLMVFKQHTSLTGEAINKFNQ